MRIRALGIAAAITTTLGLGAHPALASTASLSVVCSGIDGDVAGSVSGQSKSSKDLVALLATITKSDGLPPLPTTVSTDAPEKVRVRSGAVTANFDYRIGLDPTIVAFIRDSLGRSSITVDNLRAGVDFGGAATGGASGVVDSQTMDLTVADPAMTISMSGTFATDTSGRVFFRAAPMSMAIKIDGSVGGVANVGTLSLTCNAQGAIGSTAIQVPGSPNVPGIIDGGTVAAGQTATIPLLGRPDITTDDNNPILPDSLAITRAEGGATIVNGALVQPTAPAGGTYVNDVQLCAAARTVAAVPGVDAIQSLAFPKYGSQDFWFLNPHPLSMTLRYKGEETAAIPLTTLAGTGLEALGQFDPPTAAAIRLALEGLPSIGMGNVEVTKAASGYSIKFVEALGETDVPAISLGQWNTQLDYATYEKLTELMTKLTSPAATPDPNEPPAPPDPAATDLNVDQLWAAFQSGRITFDQFAAKFGSAVQNSLLDGVKSNAGTILKYLEEIFPQKPVLAMTRLGEAETPASSTGPLCTSFQVQTVALAAGATPVPAPPVVATATCKVTSKRIRITVKTRERANGRLVIVRRKVTALRTTRSGSRCPKTLRYDKQRKLTITTLLPTRVPANSKPKTVGVRITAKGVKGAFVKRLRVVKTKDGYAVSGTIRLPARFRKAGTIRIALSGKGIRAAKFVVRRA